MNIEDRVKELLVEERLEKIKSDTIINIERYIMHNRDTYEYFNTLNDLKWKLDRMSASEFGKIDLSSSEYQQLKRFVSFIK